MEAAPDGIAQWVLFLFSLLAAPPPAAGAPRGPVDLADAAPADAVAAFSVDLNALRSLAQPLLAENADTARLHALLPAPPRRMLAEWQGRIEPGVAALSGSTRAQWQAYADGIGRVHTVVHGASAWGAGFAMVVEGPAAGETAALLGRLADAVNAGAKGGTPPFAAATLALDGRTFTTFATPVGMLAVTAKDGVAVVSPSMPLARRLARQFDPAARDADAPSLAKRLAEYGTPADIARAGDTPYWTFANVPKVAPLLVGSFDLVGSPLFRRGRNMRGRAMEPGLGAYVDLFGDLSSFGPLVSYCRDGKFGLFAPVARDSQWRAWFAGDAFAHPALDRPMDGLFGGVGFAFADGARFTRDLLAGVRATFQLRARLHPEAAEMTEAMDERLERFLGRAEEILGEPLPDAVGRIRSLGYFAPDFTREGPPPADANALTMTALTQNVYTVRFAGPDDFANLLAAWRRWTDNAPVLGDADADGVRTAAFPFPRGLTLHFAARGDDVAASFNPAHVRDGLSAAAPGERGPNQNRLFYRTVSDTRAAVRFMMPMLAGAFHLDPAFAGEDGLGPIPAAWFDALPLFTQEFWFDDAGLHYRGDAPVDLVAGGGVMAGLLLPAMTRARQLALATSCTNNLKQIGLGAALYARDHDGVFPPDLETMLKEVGLNDPRLMRCPASGQPYHVVPAAVGQRNIPPAAITVYCEGHLRNDRRYNALFGDGHVEAMNEARFRDVMRESLRLLGAAAEDGGTVGEIF